MVLFQRNGHPLRFNLINLSIKERAALTVLIVKNGGEVIDNHKTVVKFTSHEAYCVNEYPNARIYSVQFIHDCINAKKILEPESYRLNARIPGEQFEMLDIIGKCGHERRELCSLCRHKLTEDIIVISDSDEDENLGTSVSLTQTTDDFFSANSSLETRQSDSNSTIPKVVTLDNGRSNYEFQDVMKNIAVENSRSLMGAGNVANLDTIENRQQARSPQARRIQTNRTVTNGKAFESGDKTDEAPSPSKLKKSNENVCTSSPDIEITFVKSEILSNKKSVPLADETNTYRPSGLPRTRNNGKKDFNDNKQWITEITSSPIKRADDKNVSKPEKHLLFRDAITQNKDSSQAGSSKVLNLMNQKTRRKKMSEKVSSPKRRRSCSVESKDRAISVPSSSQVPSKDNINMPGPSRVIEIPIQHHSDTNSRVNEVIENVDIKIEEPTNYGGELIFSSSSDEKMDDEDVRRFTSSIKPTVWRRSTKAKEWRDRLSANIPRPTGRKRFSVQERQSMLNYLIENRQIMSAKGLLVWKSMIVNGFAVGRTPQSLQNHFIKHILPNIESSNIKKEHMDEFLKLRDGSNAARALAPYQENRLVRSLSF